MCEIIIILYFDVKFTRYSTYFLVERPIFECTISSTFCINKLSILKKKKLLLTNNATCCVPISTICRGGILSIRRCIRIFCAWYRRNTSTWYRHTSYCGRKKIIISIYWFCFGEWNKRIYS